MNTKKCQACHSMGEQTLATHLDAIYYSGGNPSYLQLCYAHSIELFKFGQNYFVMKYRPNISFNRSRSLSSKLNNYFVFNSK